MESVKVFEVELKQKCGQEKIVRYMKALKSRCFNNQRGQVAIFVALIFQVLFVFFAMVVNIGLLVHHKINLQNSVDLAAYYGAMKQAEVLNAIAHINYQIRQSWKLMVFRHRHIGMGGYIGAPYDRENQKIINEDDQPVTYEPSFCMMYRPFDFMASIGTGTVNGGESYCRELSKDIPLPGIPSGSYGGFGGTFTQIFTAIQGISQQAVDKIKNDCRKKMTMNNFALASFIYAHKLDVANRKMVLFRLAHGLSKVKDDFDDLDGESGAKGIENTLKKNLTAQNKDGFKNMEILNSMGIGDCSGGTDMDPPPWLSEIFIQPAYDFTEFDCDDSNVIKNSAQKKLMNRQDVPLYQVKYKEGAYEPILTEVLPRLMDQPGNTPIERLYKSSMGFEKNPWCMAYVGVKASAEPSIPFSPFGSVKITATAFAKPFGGRIGPWHKEQWSSSANQSDSGAEVDKVGYVRAKQGEWWPANTDENTLKIMRPNASRYVSDKIGHKSKLTAAYYQKMLMETKDTFSITWWNHLVNEDFNDPKRDGDSLAWNSIDDKPVIMRDLEISAIAPDQYDLAYYSIEPDFFSNYQLRLQKRFANDTKIAVRGDIGQRPNNQDVKLKMFSIKDQMELANQKKYLDFNDKLTYLARYFGELLTSWQGTAPDDPRLDSSRFGQCMQDMNGRQISPDRLDDSYRKILVTNRTQPGQTATGSCLNGGRTGYSVKLVDGEYLKENLELGGNGRTGQLRNPAGNF